MTPLRSLAAVALGLIAATGAACVADDTASSEEDNLTSKSAVFLELSFAGEAIVPRGEDEAQRRKRIESQMFYLAGELDKTHGAHGQFGFVKISDVVIEPVDDDLEVVRYNAKLPVAWPKRSETPDAYRVVLPKHLDYAGLSAFNSKYAHTCGHAKYGTENLWYDFQPVTTADCELDPEDVVDVEAEVAPSPQITSGRYPDYPRFWDDGEFRMVLVHGTDSARSEDPSDFIAAAYIDFKRRLKDAYPDAEITEGETTSNIYNDWRLEAEVTGYGGVQGKLIVNTLLTSPLKYIGSDFDARFDELSGDADFIAYGGHSGLSKNIKALAAKGVVKEQKHQVVLMQGCSTFAYLDRSIADRRIEVNGAEVDPEGINFLDIVVTAQPAYAYTNTPTFITLLESLSGEEAKTYDEIVAALPQQAIPVVAAEEDNPEQAP